MIREQERIEAMIRGRGGAAGPGFFPFHRPGLGLPGPVPAAGPMGLGGPPGPGDNFGNQHINDLNADVHGFMNRMGELLQLREVQRRRNRQVKLLVK